MNTTLSTKDLYINDLHIPYHDDRAVGAMLNFAGYWHPHRVFLLGDICDFYQVSTHNKVPWRIHELQQDLDRTKDFLTHLRSAVREDTLIFWKDGTHEYRLETEKMRSANLASLRCLSIPQMLDFEKNNIQYIEYREPLLVGDFVLEHGELVRSRGGYTANGMLDKYGKSGISGHTHRGGVTYRRTFNGMLRWYENFCLCQLDPEYCTFPDWQQGFSFGYSDDDGHVDIHQVPIVDGKAFVGGVLIA